VDDANLLEVERGCGRAGAFLALQFSYISALLVQNALKFVLNSGHSRSQLSLNFVAARKLKLGQGVRNHTLHILIHDECYKFRLNRW